MTSRVLQRDDLDVLLAHLQAGGRRLVGPTVRDGAVVLDTVRSSADLPAGWTDEQQAGRYRLHRTDSVRLFAHTVGPQSFKGTFLPARERVWSPGGARPDPQPVALLGARACDLAALRIHDRVLMEGPVADDRYALRRSDVLVVAVQCDRAASTCFCPSMGSGPRLNAGFDLGLTEVVDDDGHRFVVEVGSDAGAALADQLPLRDAPDDVGAPDEAARAAEAQMTRHLDAETLRTDLRAALEGPHWDEVATRCLGCANCTLVCPTCFCTTIEDVTTLTGDLERHRRWDSCFHPSFTSIHGVGPTRAELAHRYRHWLLHKLSTWHDQFDTSGCVGCGRCIAWCPAGIDLVAEATRAGASP